MWQFQGLKGGRVHVDERLVLEVFPKGVCHGVLNVADDVGLLGAPMGVTCCCCGNPGKVEEWKLLLKFEVIQWDW